MSSRMITPVTDKVQASRRRRISTLILKLLGKHYAPGMESARRISSSTGRVSERCLQLTWRRGTKSVLSFYTRRWCPACELRFQTRNGRGSLMPFLGKLIGYFWLYNLIDCWWICCSIDKVPKVTSPTLLIHGTEDEIIDFTHGRTIFERCPKAVEPLWVEVSKNLVFGW